MNARTLLPRWIAIGLSLGATPSFAQPAAPPPAAPAPAAPDPAAGLDRAVAGLERLANADSAAIFGVPTSAQRQAIARLGAGALADADAHQAWAIAEARRLMALIQDEAVPEAERNAVGPRLNELREVVLGARLPVVRGRLLAALAAAETDPVRRAQRAGQAVAALENGEGGSVAAEAVRRVSYAGALMLQDPPLGDPRLDLARELLASVVDLPVGDDPTLAASPRARCEALAGLAIIAPSDALDAALAALRAGAAPLGAQGVELAAGTEARARLRLARLTGATPAEAFAAAAAPLTTLLAAPEASEPGPHRDAAWSRLALVVPHGADPAALPPHAAMALAVAGPHDGAASLFARVAAAPDADLAAEALWRAGALRRSAETPLPGAWAEAVTRFPDARWTRHALTEIARAFAADTRALAAIEPGAEPPVVAEARRRYAPVEPVLLAALRHAAASPAAGSTPAAWRYLAAEAGAALAEPFTLPAFEAVLRDLDAVPSDAPQASRAAPLAGRAARRALRAVSDAPPTQGVAAAASLAAIVAEHRLLKNDGALALAAATALGGRQIAAGRAAEAARTLRAAIRSDATAGAADARLLLAVALRADARPDDALAALREITDAFDAPPVVGARPEVYWLAWAEALEILAQRPDQHGAVRVRIGQLELIDPRLGGGAAAGRIAQVKSAVR